MWVNAKHMMSCYRIAFSKLGHGTVSSKLNLKTYTPTHSPHFKKYAGGCAKYDSALQSQFLKLPYRTLDWTAFKLVYYTFRLIVHFCCREMVRKIQPFRGKLNSKLSVAVSRHHQAMFPLGHLKSHLTRTGMSTQGASRVPEPSTGDHGL